MHKQHTLSHVGQLVLVALSVAACAGPTETSHETGAFRKVSQEELRDVERENGILARESVVEPFAVFETENFGLIEFFEPEAGSLLVNVARGGELKEPPGGHDVAALYFELSGEPLPQRFQQAASQGEGFSAEVEEGEPKNDPHSLIENSPSAKLIQSSSSSSSQVLETISGTAFCDRYTAYRCWPNGTDTSYAQKNDLIVQSWVHSYRGTVRQRIREKNFWGNWKDRHSVDVEESYTSYIYYYGGGNNRKKESRVDEASGNAYHHAMQFY